MMICPTDRQESHQAVVAHQLTGNGEMIYVEIVELTLTRHDNIVFQVFQRIVTMGAR
jgi:hypothetical protein